MVNFGCKVSFRDLRFSRAVIFFFFNLKEEDCRIKSEEFLRTPEFASNKKMGKTKLEALLKEHGYF